MINLTLYSAIPKIKLSTPYEYLIIYFYKNILKYICLFPYCETKIYKIQLIISSLIFLYVLLISLNHKRCSIYLFNYQETTAS